MATRRMRSTAGNVAATQDAGWTVAATYLLPDSDWAGYYDPLAARLDTLSAEGVDPDVLSEIGNEIQLRRDHGGDYGYTGYVLRPRCGLLRRRSMSKVVHVREDRPHCHG
ncbi:MAG: hypothetical protein ACRDRN_19680, partial [Sciscionella sp.]